MEGYIKMDAVALASNLSAMDDSFTSIVDTISIMEENARVRSLNWEGDAKDEWMKEFKLLIDSSAESFGNLRKMIKAVKDTGEELVKTNLKAADAMEGIIFSLL